MTKANMLQLWVNRPRVLMLVLFLVAIYGKLTSPGSLYIMVNALNPPVYTPEVVLTLLIVTESIMVWLLAFKPNIGLLFSAILLLLFSAIIVVLNAIGIRELCGCFGDAITDDIGIAKILQNLGLALLLISSWRLRKSTGKT